MSNYQLIQLYVRCVFGRVADRVVHDERGAATAEQIVVIGAAIIGAGAVGIIVWQKMSDGANNMEVPGP